MTRLRPPSGTSGSGASSGAAAAALIAQPWQANQTYSTGQLVSQAGAIYTSPSNFTAGASFNAANWSLGAVTGAQVYEQNGSGQVIAIWMGAGLGTAATKIMDVALSGLLIPGGTWAAGTAYSVDTIVTRNGSGYVAVISSTGVDPATDDGSHWQLIASKGDPSTVPGPPGTGVPATATALGVVKVSGGIADAANPTVRSADGFQVKALTADVGPLTASTTLTDVTGLSVAISASATEMWVVRFRLIVLGANTTMDIKLGFTVPTSCTMQWGNDASYWNGVAPASTPNQLLLAGGSLSLGTGANINIGIGLTAVIFGGGTAGNVQLQYAQNTSDAGALKIVKGSVLEATRVAV